jgi:hypothetical protein
MCELACQIRDLYGYKWISDWNDSQDISSSPIGPFALRQGGRRRSKSVILLSAGPYDGWTSYDAKTDAVEQRYYAALIHEMSHLTLMDHSGEMGTEEECVVLEHAWLDALKPMREIRTAYFRDSLNGTTIVVDAEHWYNKSFEDLVAPKKMKWWRDAKESLMAREVLDKDGAPTWNRSLLRWCDSLVVGFR